MALIRGSALIRSAALIREFTVINGFIANSQSLKADVIC